MKDLKFEENNQLKISIITIILIALFMGIVLWFFKGGDYSLFYSSLATLLGGTIGGIGTLIAVIITTKQTRKIQQENIKNQKLADALTCIPVLEIGSNIEKITVGKKQYNTNILYKEMYEDRGSILFWLDLKNTGKGPCEIVSYTINYSYRNNDEEKIRSRDCDNVTNKYNYNKVLPQDKEIMLQISDDNKSINSKTTIADFYFVDIYFTDILNNGYKQKFTINLNSQNEIQVEYMLPEFDRR